ncbi:MAG TPA: Darcynin 2 [Deltaproteobacteria bacterium]|nr:Darcynin 2 [Deltaproteobacteria bacterium]
MTEAPRAGSRYAAVVVLELLPAWLARSRAERNAATARLRPILDRYRDVRFRWFDADALGHGYTDFVICEFDDLERYQFLWDEIRDTEFFTLPLARIRHVMLGSEDGYRRFEAVRGA